MTGRVVRLLTAAGVLGFALVVAAPPASAHPLGTFTVNQYVGLRVTPDAVRVDYIVDLAELPAYQERTREVDADHDAEVSASEGERYAGAACRAGAGLLRLTVARRPVPVTVVAATVSFPPGAGGLSTLRLECGLRASVALSGTTAVTFRNDAHPDRIGWREVTAVGDGVTLIGSRVPVDSPSRRLTAYPDDPLAAPSDVRTAAFTVRPSPSGVAPGEAAPPTSDRGVDRLTAAFTAVVGRHRLSVGVAVAGLVLALLLGAAHALAPGHGKTVMAALLIGQEGTWRHAAVVAGSVTVTHTAGVLILGLALATSLTVAPHRLYGVLAAVSGLLLAAVGATLLRQALRARRHRRAHDHAHGHDHDHGPVRLRVRSLLTLGFAGGLLPSPSAVVVLLGAVALGRAWFGVLLVIAFGVGMAATLTGVGLALSRFAPAVARRILPRRLRRWQSTVPVLTSTVIVLIGLGLAAQALLAQH
ncbi:sulfite exporter TauE/SafE family protein [Actinoplanes sp. NPDC051346]|uniref:urease accessory protein UreH domain-containing protein n=1 Tax=Actinoplanes sp. NPDC051346 TaxID=3155048 RepID=UPI003448F81F